MIRKNVFLLFIVLLFLSISLILYSGIDNRSDFSSQKQIYTEKLKKKINELERLADENGKTINKLEKELKNVMSLKLKQDVNQKEDEMSEQKEENLDDVPNVDNEENQKVLRGNRIEHLHKIESRNNYINRNTNTCDIRLNISSPDSDLQMLDLYNDWKFDNIDGGVWKQGWPITYDENKVKMEEKLQVVVIPHSHCDPGWIKTFENYYKTQTKNILDKMAKHLNEKDGLKFIYAEISFFEMWWKDQTPETRKIVQKLVEDGKLEIVTGGWVMTDEANSHYYSMLVELFEGHEWLINNLGNEAIPKSHWSIDPFGLSPSFPHLLTSANITNAVIQRVHYSVKKELSLKKNLEFYWRQLFGKTSNRDMRTHIMPFYSYDIPHTCGPEPAVCCQFDFRRLPAGGKSCDWGIQPKIINEDNVEKRAHMIYDQYRKKSQLFQTNVIFAPLGDDFRYEVDFEWESQYNNYQRLFEYMNNKEEWNVHASFGTVKDYFDKLDESIKSTHTVLPTLSGDFFTYADRDDHYWSGYFTSRPFYKQLDRVLQNYLRAADMAFTIASIEEQGEMDQKIYNKLVTARRALSLFQHHDGVTGTAKDEVVLDYGRRMVEALQFCEEVLSDSMIIILGLDTVKPMLIDEKRDNDQVLPERRIFSIGQSVVLFNTLSRNRHETVCLYVNSPKASIVEDPSISKKQIGPVVEYNEKTNRLFIRKDVFEVCFTVEMGPLSTNSYQIVENDIQKVKLQTNRMDLDFGEIFNKPEEVESDFQIKNDNVLAMFDYNSGMLKSIRTVGDEKTIEINSQFAHYTPRRSSGKLPNGNDDSSPGAYLFLPNGEAKNLQTGSNDFVVIDGPVMKRVVVAAHESIKSLQIYSLMDQHNFIDIDTEVDIRETQNFELIIRFETNIDSGDDFYTDLNGMQMIRRRRQSKLPLQANYYPMAAGVFIEDNTHRFTVHSAQPLGVSSLKSGMLEIMLDRRLNTDDNRGLFQGVLDNKRTISHFRLLVEPMSSGGHGEKERIGFHSGVSHYASWSLHYPIIKMMADDVPKSLKFKNFENELNCNLHLVALRTLSGATNYENGGLTPSKRKAAMVVHRVIDDCRSKLKLVDDKCQNNGFEIAPSSLLADIKSSRNMSLTGLYLGQKKDSFKLEPHDVTSIMIEW